MVITPYTVNVSPASLGKALGRLHAALSDKDAKVGAAEAEFALLISDAFQRSGLGTELLGRLLDIARAENIRRVTADILPENRPMQRVCEKLGFRLVHDMAARLVKAVIEV